MVIILSGLVIQHNSYLHNYHRKRLSYYVLTGEAYAVSLWPELERSGG